MDAVTAGASRPLGVCELRPARGAAELRAKQAVDAASELMDKAIRAASVPPVPPPWRSSAAGTSPAPSPQRSTSAWFDASRPPSPQRSAGPRPLGGRASGPKTRQHWRGPRRARGSACRAPDRPRSRRRTRRAQRARMGPPWRPEQRKQRLEGLHARSACEVEVSGAAQAEA